MPLKVYPKPNDKYSQWYHFKNNSYMTSLNKCVFITYSSLIPCCNDIHYNVTSGTALCLMITQLTIIYARPMSAL